MDTLGRASISPIAVSKRLLAVFAVGVIFLILSPNMSWAAPAFSPSGHSIEVSASNAEFAFGSAKITCPKVGTTGKTASSPSAVAGLEPLTFTGTCTSIGLEGMTFEALAGTEPIEPWALEAKSTSSVAMRLPFGNTPHAQPIDFINGTCEISVKIGPITGIWTNGTNGSPVAKASTLTYAKTEMAATWNGLCPAAVNEALKASGFKILWTSVWSVKDTTAPTKAVKVE